jgi:hypothetical protein
MSCAARIQSALSHTLTLNVAILVHFPLCRPTAAVGSALLGFSQYAVDLNADVATSIVDPAPPPAVFSDCSNIGLQGPAPAGCCNSGDDDGGVASTRKRGSGGILSRPPVALPKPPVDASGCVGGGGWGKEAIRSDSGDDEGNDRDGSDDGGGVDSGSGRREDMR